MTRVVDDDLIAALDRGSERVVAAHRLGRGGGSRRRFGRSGRRLGRSDAAALDVELPAKVVGLRGRVTRGVTGDVGLVLVRVVVALDVRGAVVVAEGRVLDVGKAARIVDLPVGIRAGVVRIVRQLEVVAGDPASDLVGAVDEAERTVAVVNDRPDDGCVRRSNLVVSRGDRLRNEVPVVVGLVLDRHAVTRVVDDDLIAALNGGGQDVVAAHRLGRGGRAGGGRLGRGDGAARALDVDLEAEVIGLRGRVAAGVTGDVGLILVRVVEALDVSGAVVVAHRRVLDIRAAVRPGNLPVAVCIRIAGVVGQFEVVAGDPAHDLVCAVGEVHGAVSVDFDLPNDVFARVDELVAGGLGGLRNEVPVVVGLVLDRHLVARAVDHDLVAVHEGLGEGEDTLFIDGLAAGVDRDTAAAVDGGVVGAERYGRAVGNDFMLAVHDCERLDIVRQNHVVFHDVVEHVDGALEHCEAVAEVAQRVVVAGEVVSRLAIQRDVLAGGLVPDLDVADAVVAGRAARPDALVVLANGALDVGVDIVGDTGDLEEAAALSRSGVSRAPFQSIQELLAGDGLQAGDVAEGVDVLAGLVGDIAGDGLVAHAAAVHDGDVNVKTHVVEQVVQRIGSEVAGVGLLLTNQSLTVRVVVEGQVGVADDLAEHAVNGVDPLVLQRGDRGVGAVVARDELGGDGTLGEVDGHLADRAEVAASLGQDNLILAGVSDRLHFDRAVRVAVNEGVEASGVGDQLFRSPRLGRRIVAQVAEGDDVVGAGCLCRVDGGLHGSVQVCAGSAAGNAVDVVARLVLEVRRSGLREGFRRGDADDGDLLAVKLVHLIGLKDVRALDAVGLMIEVRGNVRELRPADGVHRAFHVVVELVVAEGRQIVARRVHHFDDALALIHGAVSGALDMVAGVDQQDACGDLLGLVLHVGNGVVGQGAVDVGMDVVGVVDDELVSLCDLLVADGADAVDVVMAERRNDFRLGLAALRAGIELFACALAGRLHGDDAVVPLMSVSGARLHRQDRRGQDLRHFSTGRVALRNQLDSGLVVLGDLSAADDALADRPVKRFLRVSGNLLRVGKVLQVIPVDLGLAIVTPHHRDELLTGHEALRIEMVLVDTIDNLVLLCPCDSILIPVVRQVNELGFIDCRNDRVFQTVEDNSRHCTGAIAVGLKGDGGHAIHKLGIVLVDVLDVLCKPVGLLDIAERLDIAGASREYGRNNACDHSDDKKQRHDLSECVFHSVSSFYFQKCGL